MIILTLALREYEININKDFKLDRVDVDEFNFNLKYEASVHLPIHQI